MLTSTVSGENGYAVSLLALRACIRGGNACAASLYARWDRLCGGKRICGQRFKTERRFAAASAASEVHLSLIMPNRILPGGELRLAAECSRRYRSRAFRRCRRHGWAHISVANEHRWVRMSADERRLAQMSTYERRKYAKKLPMCPSFSEGMRRAVFWFYADIIGWYYRLSGADRRTAAAMHSGSYRWFWQCGNNALLFCVCRHSRFGAISSDCIYIDIFSRAKIE